MWHATCSYSKRIVQTTCIHLPVDNDTEPHGTQEILFLFIDKRFRLTRVWMTHDTKLKIYGFLLFVCLFCFDVLRVWIIGNTSLYKSTSSLRLISDSILFLHHIINQTPKYNYTSIVIPWSNKINSNLLQRDLFRPYYNIISEGSEVLKN